MSQIWFFGYIKSTEAFPPQQETTLYLRPLIFSPIYCKQPSLPGPLFECNAHVV